MHDVPVFHENLFEIRCAWIVEIVGRTNSKISFVCFVLLRRASILLVNLTSVSINS